MRAKSVNRVMAALAVAATWAAGGAPALAQGAKPAPAPAAVVVTCAKDMVCAANPETVVSALQAAGYRAKLTRSGPDKPPQITSAANGYNFDIYFEGCKEGEACNSLSFWISFTKDPTNSADLANEWNASKRFSTMSFDKSDGSLAISYDVTTVGGLNQENFADVIDWWASMLGAARKFFDAHPAPAAPSAIKPATPPADAKTS
jgi:hypothetical protein